eukprot:TRINITY_DN1885_c2_g1_i1.p1 TRINITY_DN1885_c2_g1~~TRINITY_DN1885_c2_g1_i1.p1  ORF type:complete len:1069 (+),score=182.13 TRINITY_DN1885_c2_g1_i1:43-3207(+)
MAFGTRGRMSTDFGRSTDSVVKIKLSGESSPRSLNGRLSINDNNIIRIPYCEKDVMSLCGKQSFMLKGVTWPTLERYLMAQQFLKESDREVIRLATASEVDQNREAWESLPKHPDWESSRDGIALNALRWVTDPKVSKAAAAFVSNPKNQKKHIIYECPHNSYWGSGEQPSESGQNRLGQLLSQVIIERTMPSFVPRELYDDPTTFGPEYDIDTFVSRLSHRLLESRSEDMRQDFESLFKCAGELLKCRKSRAIENLKIKSEALSEAKVLFDDELHSHDGALQVLNCAKQRIDHLQTDLSTVVNATAATGKRLSVIDKEISRAAETRLLVEQFNCFNSITKSDHDAYTGWLSELRKYQRSVHEQLREAQIRNTPAPQEDDPESIEILKDKISSFSLPSNFQLGVYSSGLPTYSNEKKCVEAVRRLKGLVSEWNSKRAGVQNVTSFETFLSNALVEDLVGMQNQLHQYLSDDSIKMESTKAESLFYVPMRQVERLLTELGYPQAAARSYKGNIRIYRAAVQQVDNHVDHQNVDPSDNEDDDSATPPNISSALKGVEQLLRLEAPIVRKVFASPESVLNSILQSTIEQLNIPELVKQALEPYTHRAGNARKIQDFLLSRQGIKQLYEPDGLLAKRTPEMPPRSPTTQRFFDYATSLIDPNDPGPPSVLHKKIKNDLARYSKVLCSIHETCSEFVRSTTEIASECKEYVCSVFDSIFAEPRKAFETYEPDHLIAFYKSQAEADGGLVVFVRLGQHSCRESITKAQQLCTTQAQQKIAMELCLTFLKKTCTKISSAISESTKPVLEELKKPVDKQDLNNPVHIKVLEAVCEAVTAIEMLDSCIETQFKPILSVAGAQSVAAKRSDQLSKLETLLGKSVGSAIHIVASRSLGALLKQKKNDFSKKDALSEALYTSNATSACSECTTYLRAQYEGISKTLQASPTTLKSASELLMHLLIKGIFAHVKSFTVTTEGAFQLKRDCTEYKNVAATIGTSHSQEFELLLEICNIPMVSPSNLKLILNEGRLEELPSSELVDFLKIRSDWKDIRKKELKGYFDDL